MKTRTFIGMMVLLIALVGITACGEDDNPTNETPEVQ